MTQTVQNEIQYIILPILKEELCIEYRETIQRLYIKSLF
jgi:hypothetical protein